MPGRGGSDPGGAPEEDGKTEDRSAAPDPIADEEADGMGSETL